MHSRRGGGHGTDDRVRTPRPAALRGSTQDTMRMPVTLILAGLLLFLGSSCGSSSGGEESASDPDSSEITPPSASGESGQPGSSAAPSEDGPPPRRTPAPPPDLSSEDDGPVEIPTPTGEVFGDPPGIRLVTPSGGPAEGGTLVVVRGDHFTSDVLVTLDGIEQSAVDVIDARELWFVTEPGPAGPVMLRIQNEAGVATLADAFTYDAALRIERLVPETGSSSGGTPVRLEGQAFRDDTRVMFGEREALEVRRIDAETLEVLAPPGPPGRAVALRVFDDRFAELSDAFRYRRAPVVRTLVPSRGTSRGGERIWIVGEGLDADCELRIGTQTVPLTARPDGVFEAVSPGGSPGEAAVAWRCGGRGEGIVPEPFVFGDARPRGIHAIHPEVGLSSGGEVVLIEASGLDPDAPLRVFFGGAEATVLEYGPQGALVLTPRVIPLTVTVRLQQGAESLRLNDGFTFIDVPRFDGLTPASVDLEGGSVVLTGEDLRVVREVRLDGAGAVLEATPVRGQVRFHAPAGPPGRATVAVRVGHVQLPTGLDLTWSEDFSVHAFQPVSGSVGGGTRLSVIGRGFDSECVVEFGGVALPTEQLGTSLLQARTPPGRVGEVPVAVTGCASGGAHTFEEPFRYVSGEIFPGGAGGGPLAGELTVAVREFGTFAPVPGATVQVGVRSTTPWAGVTGPSGEVVFLDADLVGPQTVTAFAPGRGVESIVDVDARRVTLMLAQLPPEPCDPADPECQGDPPPPAPRPSPPPPGAVRGWLTGLEKIDVLPDGTIPWAELETTRAFAGLPNPDPGPDRVLRENGPFFLTTRLGDFALIARCGYYEVASGRFFPVRMGVVRSLSQRPGDPVAEADIDCNLPLDRGFDVHLDNAPEIPDPDRILFPAAYRASLVYDFGTEGVLEGYDRFEGTRLPLRVGGLPPLAGPLAGVRYSVTAGVYPRQGTLPGTNSWARQLRAYPETLRMPPLLPVPTFVIPGPVHRFSDGYVEWAWDEDLASPDLWHLTVTAQNQGFDRWSVFVPGDHRAFHLTDFPTWAGLVGPDLPAGTLQVLVRAIRLTSTHDPNDFVRDVLGQARWEATSIQYQNLLLTPGAGVNP